MTFVQLCHDHIVLDAKVHTRKFADVAQRFEDGMFVRLSVTVLDSATSSGTASK
jgi:hypothetical protein